MNSEALNFGDYSILILNEFLKDWCGSFLVDQCSNKIENRLLSVEFLVALNDVGRLKVKFVHRSFIVGGCDFKTDKIVIRILNICLEFILPKIRNQILHDVR